MSIDENPFRYAWNAIVNTKSAPEGSYDWALWGYRVAVEAAKAPAIDQPVRPCSIHGRKAFNAKDISFCHPSCSGRNFGVATPGQPVELSHIFETGNGQNPYRPRIIDLCYTAFLMAKEPNAEVGGPSDWFTDTKPRMDALIARMKERVHEREISAVGRRVIDAACSVVHADTYKHPVLDRDQAVKEGVAELHDAVNAYHSAQPATLKERGRRG